MYKYKHILIILLFFSQRSDAQQNNIWYFGDKAGLSFNAIANNSIPSPLQNSAMVAINGCASISDNNGQLLFYTNGVTVYNHLNKVMLNGDNLKGNLSACQSSIIIPVPGNDSIYYIFTTDGTSNFYANGYRYSIVNMNKDNGNGELVSKNNLLWASSTDRLTAARHANGIDVWLITNDNNSNIFRAWLITCNGLQMIPIVSSAGLILDNYSLDNQGYIKVSPDGKQLCQTHRSDLSPYSSPNFIQLFDFNNATGTLSNAQKIDFPGVHFFSCEYSSDSKLLYLTCPDVTFDSPSIYQLENTLGTPAAIVASKITIGKGIEEYWGIQLAPDKKIYLSSGKAGYVGAINNPNTKWPGCNFQPYRVKLNNPIATFGLPGSINDLSYDPYNGFINSIIDSCQGTVQLNGRTSITGPVQWDWDFGDGTTSNVQNPVHIFTPADQVYTVRLKITSSLCGGIIYRSENIKPQGISTKIDFDYISDCNSDNVTFINKTPFAADSAGQFIWDFDDGTFSNAINPVHTYSFKDTFNVKLRLITSPTCLNRTISHDVNLVVFQVKASTNQTILIGQTVHLNATSGGKTYEWTPATWLNNPSIKNPSAKPLEDIMYKITVTNHDNCISEDSVFIKVLQFNEFYVPTGFTPNNDGKNDRIKPLYGKDLNLEEFSILNRWGQTVYTTHTRDEGWDGKVNNVLQNPDVFVWIIKAIDPTGVHYQKQGTFVLIR